MNQLGLRSKDLGLKTYDLRLRTNLGELVQLLEQKHFVVAKQFALFYIVASIPVDIDKKGGDLKAYQTEKYFKYEMLYENSRSVSSVSCLAQPTMPTWAVN